jgi:hypothetical protein
MPLADGLDTAEDLPHTVSYAILYRMKIDSLHELPKDKQPPRDLWNKPHKLEEFFDEMYGDKEKKEFIEYNDEDVE